MDDTITNLRDPDATTETDVIEYYLEEPSPDIFDDSSMIKTLKERIIHRAEPYTKKSKKLKKQHLLEQIFDSFNVFPTELVNKYLDGYASPDLINEIGKNINESKLSKQISWLPSAILYHRSKPLEYYCAGEDQKVIADELKHYTTTSYEILHVSCVCCQKAENVDLRKEHFTMEKTFKKLGDLEYYLDYLIEDYAR